MAYGLRTYDANGKLMYDSLGDETMYFYDEIQVRIPTTSQTVKNYPELQGRKIYVAEIHNSDDLSNNGNYFPAIDGHTLQPMSVTYPNNIPRITVTAAPLANPGGTYATRHIVVMVDGTGLPKPTWGANFVNGANRTTISAEADPYVYLGGFRLSNYTGGRFTAVPFTCVGTPLVFSDLASPGTSLAGVYRQGSTNNWVAVFNGAYAGTSVNMRVFGRLSLNRPNGATGHNWGFRLRNPATGRITFDSNLPMLALKGYTAQQTPTMNRNTQNVNVGFNTNNCSILGWFPNNITVETWSNPVPAGGLGYRWNVTINTYVYNFTSSGNYLAWGERHISRWVGNEYDSASSGAGTFTYKNPDSLTYTKNLAIIDNSRYPI